MASMTYYVVLPFVRNEEGDLCPEEAIECQSPQGAASRAKAVAALKGGAVAFSRTGDPNVGDFDDAVILATIGDVPADLTEALGG